MRLRVAAVLCVFAGLIGGGVGAFAGIYGLDKASQNSAELRVAVSDLRLLLLDGKTSSARSAKLTATEVQTGNAELAILHTQNARGEKVLKRTIRTVERHLDRTIVRAVNHAAASTVRRLK